MNELLLTEQEKALLSLQGTNGDTEIGYIDEKPAHLMKVEKGLIDRAGKKGEDFVKAISPAKKNPNTGLDSHSIFSELLKGNLGPVDVIGEVIDWATPTTHTGWLSSDWTKTGDIQAKNIVDEGMIGLQKDLEANVGPDGSLTREYGMQTETLQNTAAAESEKVLESIRQTSGKAGFASGGPMQNLISDFVDSQEVQSKQLLNKKIDTTRDYISKINKDKNAILMDYLAATEESYSGDELDKLNTLIDQYDGTV